MQQYKANVLHPNDFRTIKDGDIGSLEELTQAAQKSGLVVSPSEHLLQTEIGSTTCLGWLELEP